MRSEINLDAIRPDFKAENLPALVERYIRDARVRVDPGTASSYDYLLSLLLEWFAEAIPALESGCVLDATAWRMYERWLSMRLSSQSGAPMTLASRRKALSVVRQLLRWAHEHGYLPRDFGDQVPAAKGQAMKRPALGVAELRALMAAAAEGGKPLRDAALVAVLIGTGIRRAEAAGLDVPDVQWHAHGGGLLLVRVAKLSKARQVVFDDACGRYLLALVEDLGRSSGPLFCGWHGARLTPKSTYAIVKRAMVRAGVDHRGAGPHDLRRAFATAWLRNRRSLGDGQLLSMQLGHSAEQMSVLYSRPTLDDLANGFASPLSVM